MTNQGALSQPHNVERHIQQLWRARQPCHQECWECVCTFIEHKTIGHEWHSYTLPKHNIAPGNMPSQKEISIPTIHFQVLCWLYGCIQRTFGKIYHVHISSTHIFATHFRVAQDSELQWQIRCEYDFKYGPSSFGQMPLWAHLLPTSLAQRLGSRYKVIQFVTIFFPS